MDWGEAIRVACVGFGGVCIILALLALVIWLFGSVVGKIGVRTKNLKENQSEGEKEKD